jgi:hypothetical protein
MRRKNAEWFNRHKAPNERLRFMVKEVSDMIDSLLNEGWIIYGKLREQAQKDDKLGQWLAVNKVRESLLNTIREKRILGMAQKIDELWLVETVEKLLQEQDRISKLRKWGIPAAETSAKRD